MYWGQYSCCQQGGADREVPSTTQLGTQKSAWQNPICGRRPGEGSQVSLAQEVIRWAPAQSTVPRPDPLSGFCAHWLCSSAPSVPISICTSIWAVDRTRPPNPEPPRTCSRACVVPFLSSRGHLFQILCRMPGPVRPPCRGTFLPGLGPVPCDKRKRNQPLPFLY